MVNRLRFLLLRLFFPAMLFASVGCAVVIQGTGDGSGSVTYDTGIMGSPNVCQYSDGTQIGDCFRIYLLPGTVVTLTATAASGSNFTGWSGDCDESQIFTPVSATCKITIGDTIKFVKPNFELIPPP
jgi:hypothetical protein